MIVDHIGYLVKDIERAVNSFLVLGYTKESEIINDEEDHGGYARNIRICFLRNGGGTRIELVSPICGKPNDIDNKLKRQGEGPYHICYCVQSLEKTIDDLCACGWMVIKPPMTAIACGGKRVSFLFRNTVGLIELIEKAEV